MWEGINFCPFLTSLPSTSFYFLTVKPNHKAKTDTIGEVKLETQRRWQYGRRSVKFLEKLRHRAMTSEAGTCWVRRGSSSMVGRGAGAVVGDLPDHTREHGLYAVDEPRWSPHQFSIWENQRGKSRENGFRRDLVFIGNIQKQDIQTLIR